MGRRPIRRAPERSSRVARCVRHGAHWGSGTTGWPLGSTSCTFVGRCPPRWQAGGRQVAGDGRPIAICSPPAARRTMRSSVIGVIWLHCHRRLDVLGSPVRSGWLAVTGVRCPPLPPGHLGWSSVWATCAGRGRGARHSRVIRARLARSGGRPPWGAGPWAVFFPRSGVSQVRGTLSRTRCSVAVPSACSDTDHKRRCTYGATPGTMALYWSVRAFKAAL